MSERKSLKLSEAEINILTLALSNHIREIDSHVDTLRAVNNFDTASKQDRKDLNDRMDDYFNVKDLRSFLYGVFDN